MLRCRTLGALELVDSSGREHTAVLSQPKRVALLVYLVVAGARGFLRRDTLLALFWPELDEEHARAALRQALTFLRHELGEDVIRSRGAEEVGIEPERLWCDAVAFDDAVRSGDLEGALALYRGDFLAGVHISECAEFERWLEAQRNQLRDRAADAASRLVDRAEGAGSRAEAARWARRALELRPDDEHALQQLVVSLDRTGDRARALREYQSFAERLAAEYQAKPSPETQAIVSEIRARPGSSPTPTAGPTPPALAQALQASVAWRRQARLVAILGGLVVAGVGAYRVLDSGGGATTAGARPDVPRLAVLPFENLGAPEDEFFADGITEEIMTKLAGLSGLAVISSQSAMKYKGTQKSTSQIGTELDVQYLLQARIQWQRLPDGSSRVRVTPRLIRVADDRHLWAGEFDEVLQDVFRVESEIATQVTSALRIALASGEQRSVSERPTQNLEAYEYYLRGNASFRAGWPTGPPMRDAVGMYQRAIELDPGFATAYPRLSMAHGNIRWAALDPGRDQEHLARQAEYAGRAVALDPALPEGHLAMGWYHYEAHRDYQRALQEFRIASAAEPNNSSFIEAEATVYKRTGNVAAAAARYARASDLDPLSSSPAAEAGVQYILLRRYDQAERYLERHAAIGVRPGAYALLAYLRLVRDGDPSALRAWLDSALGPAGFPQFIAGAAHGGGWAFLSMAVVRTLCGECGNAIPLVPSRREEDWQRYGAIALLHEQAGRLERARLYYDSLTRRLEGVGFSPPAALYPSPTAYAKLGRKDEAVRAGIERLKREKQAKDVFAETMAIRDLAEVHVTVGEYDSALEHLEWLLTHPSPISVPLLRVDPLWDPLRNNPRFHALLAKYQNTGRN